MTTARLSVATGWRVSIITKPGSQSAEGLLSDGWSFIIRTYYNFRFSQGIRKSRLRICLIFAVFFWSVLWKDNIIYFIIYTSYCIIVFTYFIFKKVLFKVNIQLCKWTEKNCATLLIKPRHAFGKLTQTFTKLE